MWQNQLQNVKFSLPKFNLCPYSLDTLSFTPISSHYGLMRGIGRMKIDTLKLAEIRCNIWIDCFTSRCVLDSEAWPKIQTVM